MITTRSTTLAAKSKKSKKPNPFAKKSGGKGPAMPPAMMAAMAGKKSAKKKKPKAK